MRQGKQAIATAVKRGYAAVGTRLVDVGYYGDGNGVVVADQANRVAYYWKPAPGGQRTVGTAVLHPNANLPFQNLTSTGLLVAVDLGYPPNDGRLHIMGQNGTEGIAATGGGTLSEQKINAAAFQPAADVPEWRCTALATINEVFIAGGMYEKESTGDILRWYGGDTRQASTTVASRIAALSGTGKHQLCWVCFDKENAKPSTAANTAATPVGALPARAEWGDAAFTGISSSDRKLIPVYLYDGQVLADADFYRMWDARFKM